MVIELRLLHGHRNQEIGCKGKWFAHFSLIHEHLILAVMYRSKVRSSFTHLLSSLKKRICGCGVAAGILLVKLIPLLSLVAAAL